MSQHDPERWLRSSASEDAGLSTLLQAGRAERPSEAQLSALAKRLGPTFSAPPSGGGGAAGAAAAGAPLVPLVIGGLLALGIATVWLSTRSANPRASEAPRHAQPVLDARPVPRAASTPRTPVPAAPNAGPVIVDGASTSKPAPHARPAAPTRAQDSAVELALLEEAHRKLTTDPRRTLEVAETHLRLFPRGQYEQEREVLAIEALLALHRGARATARATRFLARHPESSHARRIRALLAARVP